MDWGFGLLAGLVKIVELPPTFLMFIISAFSFLAISKASQNFGLTTWSPIPFYTSTFFITHQFMQIRQGLSIAIIFLGISYLISSKKKRFRIIVTSMVGWSFHLVSIIPLIFSVVLKRTLPRSHGFNNMYWVISILVITIGLCRAISSFELFLLIDRMQAYVDNTEYNSARSILDIANLRAIVFAFAFYLLRPNDKDPSFSAYMLLLGIFIVGLGVRLGFLDFAILSGRVGSAFGFSEIFLLPFVINNTINNNLKRYSLIFLYFSIHLSATFFLKVPFLFEDYFEPIP